jgi:hypothetical protein
VLAAIALPIVLVRHDCLNMPGEEDELQFEK